MVLKEIKLLMQKSLDGSQPLGDHEKAEKDFAEALRLLGPQLVALWEAANLENNEADWIANILDARYQLNYRVYQINGIIKDISGE